jgi:hypothetical protein
MIIASAGDMSFCIFGLVRMNVHLCVEFTDDQASLQSPQPQYGQPIKRKSMAEKWEAGIAMSEHRLGPKRVYPGRP